MYKKKVVVEKTLSLREKKGVVVCERKKRIVVSCRETIIRTKQLRHDPIQAIGNEELFVKRNRRDDTEPQFTLPATSAATVDATL
jgi:hypothetical protein